MLPSLSPTMQCVGADALMLYFGDEISAATGAQVHSATALIDAHLGNDVVDLVPSYSSLLVIFDPLQFTHVEMTRRLRAIFQREAAEPSTGSRVVELPVYYAAETGPDLTTLAREAGLAVAEVIELHSAREYQVFAIGFAPGFAYLGELDERIARPRHASPRERVTAGSVGIADRQTAVYPADSPGGWNLIGRCPTRMFDPEGDPPMPVAVGDRVRFKPISREQYLALGGTLP